MNETTCDSQSEGTEGKLDLAGRLMPVEITKTQYRNGRGRLMLPNCAQVFVTNGARILDPDGRCLVKFDSEPGTDQGNMVVSGFPKDTTPEGWEPGKYIFYGAWENWMKKEGFLPTLEEVNKYYDPGQAPWFLYLSKDCGPFAIYAHRPPRFLSGKNYERIMAEDLPDPKRASRLVIGDSPSMLRGFRQECKRQGIRAFKLDNLEYNWRALRTDADLSRREQAPVTQQKPDWRNSFIFLKLKELWKT
jgi:hypothetical protein